jgi:hypothetical protein
MNIITNTQNFFTQKQSHTGGSIGGDAAKIYSVEIAKNGATFLISGCTVHNGYADAEWYQNFDMPSGSTRLRYSRDLLFSPSYATDSQADESDCIPVDMGGNRYNGSTQIVTETGELQIGKGSGGWQRTGLYPGPYPTGIIVPVDTYYTFDFTKGVISILAVGIGANLYQIPSDLWNQPSQKSNWQNFNQVMVQEQLDLNEKAGSYTKTVNNGRLILS